LKDPGSRSRDSEGEGDCATGGKKKKKSATPVGKFLRREGQELAQEFAKEAGEGGGVLEGLLFRPFHAGKKKALRKESESLSRRWG